MLAYFFIFDIIENIKENTIKAALEDYDEAKNYVLRRDDATYKSLTEEEVKAMLDEE